MRTKKILSLYLSIQVLILAAGPLSPGVGILVAQPPTDVPKEIQLPPPSSLRTPQDLLNGPVLAIARPELSPPGEVSLPKIPDFYAHSHDNKLPETFRTFLAHTLIPLEAQYFQPGFGIDPESGMPYDHVRIRLKENMLSEVGHYTAASKLSLFIPFLLKVIQKDPAFSKIPLTPGDAETLLRQCLDTLILYKKKYPEQGGFLPWVDIRPNGTIAPSDEKIPSLDNGQMTWALAAVVAAFENSSEPSRVKIAKNAQAILNTQDYGRFYDPKKGLLHGTVQLDQKSKKWMGDRSYYLDDMFEGTLAVLWGVLHGQIPEETWDRLKIPTTEYLTADHERITVLKGFRASFHECWALAFIPFMESALAPLYQNYLYAQADYARRQKLPGFLSTAYDPKGIYRQMGIPGIAARSVDRDDVSVFFATCMGMLVSPTVGALWINYFYHLPKFISSYGAIESVGRDGYADIFTADAKGMTLLAVTGGLHGEIRQYLRTRTAARSGIPMDIKLTELLHAKYKQMLHERLGKPLYFPTQPFPVPARRNLEVQFKKPEDPGEHFDITGHLQSGHLHGKNVRTIDHPNLEQDIRPGKPLAFDYEIPAYTSYFDQWAFRGTYLDRAVRIADMRYLTVTMPAQTPPNIFEIELKSDDITLATVVINTKRPGKISENGTSMTYVESIKPIPESEEKPLNYVSVVLHDPRYLLDALPRGGREGRICLENMALGKRHPFGEPGLPGSKPALKDPPGFEAIRYWRLSHGSIPFKKNAAKGTYLFSGGLGWRGGYIPYTNLEKFRFIYLRARNIKGERNYFFIEFKNEDNQLLTAKVPVVLPKDMDWSVFEIKIPQGSGKTFNYLAISDPEGDFELASVHLSPHELRDSRFRKIKVDQNPWRKKHRDRRSMEGLNSDS